MLYAFVMENYEKKMDGFRGQWMVVLPTESFLPYIKHPQIQRLYLTDVGYFPHADQHFRERKDGIEEYIYIYCIEGEGEIVLNGEEIFPLHEKEAFCIPAYCGHRYYSRSENPWSILWVHFKGTDCQYYPLEQTQVIRFGSNQAANRLMNHFDQLQRVLEKNYTLGNFIYISQILGLILSETYFREKHNTAGAQNKQVTNVIRYMYEHISEEITLEQLAEEFHCSKSYLNGIFKKYTEHTPVDFFIRLKMNEACKLLRSTHQHIYQIGQELGYSDPYYFSRIFRKVIGISPKNYRDRS